MKLKVNKREVRGSKNKVLRKQGILPAVIMAPGKESISIESNYLEFLKLYRKSGDTKIVDLDLDGKEVSVLVKEVQYHPVTDDFSHITFYEVDLTKKVNVTVPIEYLDEEENPLIKSNEALLTRVVSEVELESLPREIPDVLEITVKDLETMEDHLTLGQLKEKYKDSKFEIHGEEDIVIASLGHAVSLEIEEEEATEVNLDEIETTSEKKEEEGSVEESKPKTEDK